MPHVPAPAATDVLVASSSRSSGLRPRTASPTAPTLEMPAVAPITPGRREPPWEPIVERTSLPARRPSNDAGESQDLINNSDHRSTRYCFVAPRKGRP
jgi:hypothetical protein